MVMDVKRAFLYGKARRKIYIRLPPEDPRSKESGTVGLVKRSMYGTRDAPQIWAEEVRRVFTSLGFQSCRTDACVYSHPGRGIVAVTHVDDFMLCGVRSELDWVFKPISAEFEVKSKVLGPDAGEDLQVEFLGRQLRWTRGGIEYEPNPKHVHDLLQEMGLDDAKAVCSPGVTDGSG